MSDMLKFDLEAEMRRGAATLIKSEVTQEHFCTLTPEQTPAQRAKARADVALKQALKDEEDRLKMRLKEIKALTDACDTRILRAGEALNHEPPTGRFAFVGDHYASMALRKEWLVDLQTGAPIVETCVDIQKSTILELDRLRDEQAQLPLFGGASDESGPEESPEADDQADDDNPFADPQGGKKGDPNPDLQ